MKQISKNNTYYQTTPLSQIMVAQYNDEAKSQDDAIYKLMQNGDEWTAWQIKAHFPKYEITSIRRALFNLVNKAKLIEHTGYVIDGGKGRPVGKYKVINYIN